VVVEQDISGAEETQSRSAFDLGFNLQCCRNLMYKAKEGGRRRKRSEGKKQGRREKNEKASCPAYQNFFFFLETLLTRTLGRGDEDGVAGCRC